MASKADSPAKVIPSAIPSGDEMSPEAAALIREVKKYYLEKNEIKNNFHEPIPIERGYAKLAIVREEEQERKMRDAFAKAHAQEEVSENLSVPRLFEDKRITCFEQIYGPKTPVELKDIFEPDKQEGQGKDKAPKRLLVLGRAGIGKSTLCQYMAYQWANPEAEVKLWQANGKERFKLVVWVPLRNLLDSNNKTIYDVILTECIPTHTFDSSKKTLSLEIVITAVDHISPSKILFILDGYDEVAGKENQIIKDLLKLENIILTSRPHGIGECLTSVSIDRKLENIGFFDKDIKRYIKTYFGESEENKKYSDSLVAFLKAHPNIWGIAHIPINLMLICFIWKDNYGVLDLNHIEDISITDLYLGVIAKLGYRYFKLESEGIKKLEHRKILNHEKCKPVLAVLSELAFEQMDGESLLIPGKKLTGEGLAARYRGNAASRNDVINFGVLTPTRPETESEKTEFYFIHLTFQEFLAACYIAEKLRENDEEVKNYILKNKYSRRHEMVWWFVAGLLKEETEILERFFDILEAPPRDLAEIYHQMLLMRCMDECHLKVTPRQRATYLNNLCQLIDKCLDEKRFFYRLLWRYLNLSTAVVNQSVVVDRFCSFLNKKEASKKHVVAVVDVLQNLSNLPRKIIDCITSLISDSDENVRIAVINFFRGRSDVKNEIEKSIAILIIEVNSKTTAAAVSFFGSRRKVNKEIEKSITALLKHEDEYARASAVKFFGTREKVEREVEQNIDLLLNDPKWRVRAAALNFFGRRQEVSEETQEKIAGLFLHHDEYARAAVISFFRGRENVPKKIQKEMANLHRDPVESVRIATVFLWEGHKEISEEIRESLVPLLVDPVATMSFFDGHKEGFKTVFEKFGAFLGRKEGIKGIVMFLEKISPKKVIEYFKELDKCDLDKEFLIALSAVFLVLKFPVHLCNNKSIQIGLGEVTPVVIPFDNEEELAVFVRKFQQVFREFTGLDLDGKLQSVSALSKDNEISGPLQSGEALPFITPQSTSSSSVSRSIASPEEFSPTETMSNIGHFSASRATSEEDKPEELNEEVENKCCKCM